MDMPQILSRVLASSPNMSATACPSPAQFAQGVSSPSNTAARSALSEACRSLAGLGLEEALARGETELRPRVHQVGVGLDARDVGAEGIPLRLEQLELRGRPGLVAVESLRRTRLRHIFVRGLHPRELLPLVRAGVSFKDGVRVERDDGQVAVLVTKGVKLNKEKRGKIAP